MIEWKSPHQLLHMWPQKMKIKVGVVIYKNIYKQIMVSGMIVMQA